MLLLVLLAWAYSPPLVGQGWHSPKGIKKYKPVRLSKSVKAAVALMEAKNDFAFSLRHYEHEPPRPLFESFQRLNKEATEKELLYLVESTSPVVRCYAFWSLVLRNYPGWFDLLIRNLPDPGEVEVIEESQSLYPIWPVGDIMLSMVSSESITPAQQHTLDSVLLFDPRIRLLARASLLQKLLPQPQYYERVRQLAASGQEFAAVVALARFRKPQDRVYIHKLLSQLNFRAQTYALWAVSEYPDSSFFPGVEKVFHDTRYNRSGKRLVRLYRAMVRYETPEMAALFQQRIHDPDTANLIADHHMPHIYVALEKYGGPYWQSFKESMRLSEADKKDYMSMFGGFY